MHELINPLEWSDPLHLLVEETRLSEETGVPMLYFMMQPSLTVILPALHKLCSHSAPLDSCCLFFNTYETNVIWPLYSWLLSSWMQHRLEKFFIFLSFFSFFYEIWIDFDEVSKCEHCHMLLLMRQITFTMNVTTVIMQLISPYHMANDRNFLHINFFALSETKLQSVCMRWQSRKTVILIYVSWLELCTYSLLPCVM